MGVNSLTGGGHHYYTVLRPANRSDRLQVSDIYPGQYELAAIGAGEHPIAGHEDIEARLPEEFVGQTVMIALKDRRNEAQLVNVLRITPYPSSKKADHVVLTWSEDPRTTMTIQWRTDASVDRGYVLYQKKTNYYSFSRKKPMRVIAEMTVMETRNIANDPLCHRHTAILRGLEPGTDYVYSIGEGEMQEFSTAPAGIEPFSFIYMGDAQNGLERWGSLIQGAFRRHPDAAFYIMAAIW